MPWDKLESFKTSPWPNPLSLSSKLQSNGGANYSQLTSHYKPGNPYFQSKRHCFQTRQRLKIVHSYSSKKREKKLAGQKKRKKLAGHHSFISLPVLLCTLDIRQLCRNKWHVLSGFYIYYSAAGMLCISFSFCFIVFFCIYILFVGQLCRNKWHVSGLWFAIYQLEC